MRDWNGEGPGESSWGSGSKRGSHDAPCQMEQGSSLTDRQTEADTHRQAEMGNHAARRTDRRMDGSLGAAGHSDLHGLTTVPRLEFHEPSFFKDLGVYLKDIIS